MDEGLARVTGTFVAVWPVEDQDASAKTLLHIARSELQLLAERAGVRMTGEPTLVFTDHATVGLCVTARVPATEVL